MQVLSSQVPSSRLPDFHLPEDMHLVTQRAHPHVRHEPFLAPCPHVAEFVSSGPWSFCIREKPGTFFLPCAFMLFLSEAPELRGEQVMFYLHSTRTGLGLQG